MNTSAIPLPITPTQLTVFTIVWAFVLKILPLTILMLFIALINIMNVVSLKVTYYCTKFQWNPIPLNVFNIRYRSYV